MSTKTKKAVQSLGESIFIGLSQPVLLLDASLKAVVANPAFLGCFNLASAELQGRHVEEIIVLGAEQPILTEHLRSVTGQAVRLLNLEVTCLIPPRTRRVFSLNAQRITAARGRGMVLLEARDITSEKKIERKIHEMGQLQQRHGMELEAANEELESFNHSVSHDLRLPLRLTNKIAHLLLQDHYAELTADATAKLHMILESTSEMGTLIDDLLAFSRINRGPMARRRVDMARLAREAQKELQEETEGRRVRITIDPLPSGHADRALLKQVYLNLLANALKFTRPCTSAEIHVGSLEQGEETLYFVRDNGVGFGMSEVHRLFLPFYRLHKQSEFEGSGVGLALVKRIIERHGGTISAEGKPGEGGTFYFTLGNFDRPLWGQHADQ